MPLIERLEELVPQIIKEKKDFLLEEFGDASDYGIKGVVVVGSVAEGKERPDSDVDIYIISDSQGFEDDFLEELKERLKEINEKRQVDHLYTISLEEADEFETQKWDFAATKRTKGYVHKGFRVILVG